MRAMKKEPCWLGLRLRQRSLWEEKAKEKDLWTNWKSWPALPERLFWKKIIQRRPAKDPAFFIGRGKVEELSLICQALDANLIIFDDELSGVQMRNIEEMTGVKVVDRTTLIWTYLPKGRVPGRENFKWNWPS